MATICRFLRQALDTQLKYFQTCEMSKTGSQPVAFAMVAEQWSMSSVKLTVQLKLESNRSRAEEHKEAPIIQPKRNDRLSTV